MVYNPKALDNTEVQFLKDGVVFNTEEVTYTSIRWL